MMKSTITLKTSGETIRFDEAAILRVERPGVVALPLDPAQVARVTRTGDDLVLVLRDGSTFTIRGFFLVDEEGERSDLVMVDDAGVVWWAQYVDSAAIFEITEIEHGLVPVPWGFFGGGALLAALAAAGGGGETNTAPVLVADTASVTEAGVALGGNTAEPGVAVATGNVLNNDSDPEGDVLAVTGIATGGVDGALDTPLAGIYGALVIGADGTFTYTLDNSRAATQALAAGETATEIFTYTVSDGNGGTASTTLTITVTGTNDAPVVVVANSDLSGTVTEAGGLANGTPGVAEAAGQLVSDDVDNDATAVWTLDGPADATYGSFTLNADGSWRFVLDNDLPATQALNAGESVTVTYPVRVMDEHGAFAVTQVTITVNGANDTAVIGGVTEGAVVEAGGVSNAGPGIPSTGGTLTVTDPDDNDEGFRTPAPGALNGTYGTFTFDPVTGDWTYTLDNSRIATQALTEGQEVTETLTVESADGSASQVITVTVTGSNDVPVVSDGSAILVEDTDVDADGMLVATGTLTITDPDAGESAFDPASLAFVPAVPGALPLGVMVVNANGAWTYEIDNSLPAVQALAASETLTETFTVVSLDGTATSTITITVTGTNDVPVIAGNDVGEVHDDGVTAPDVSGQLTVSDVDTSDTHSWSIPGATGSYGTLVVDSTTGTWTYTLDPGNPDVRAIPEGGTLTDVITVQVDDGNGGITTRDVTITIHGTNDAPVAQDDTGTTDETTVLTVTGPGLLANDSDIDGDPLVVSEIGAGTPVVAGGTQIAGSTGGIFTVYPDGSYSFDPDGDFDDLAEGDQRLSTLSYTISDGNGGTATATLTITVTGTNTAPVLVADTASVTEAGVALGGNTAEPGVAVATGNVLNNDSDPEGDVLAVTGIATGGVDGALDTPLAGIYGALVIGADGTFTYTLDNSRAATQALAAGETATEIFTYTVSDGNGGTASTTLTITVTGTNDAPVVVVANSDLSGTVTEAGGLANGTPGVAEAAGQLVSDDVDNDATAVWTLDGPADATYGSFTLNADGSWRFVLDNDLPATQALNAGESVTVTYPVRVMDEHGAFAVTQVTITVNGANDTAVIGGVTEGAVVEAGGVSNAGPGIPSTGGTLTVTDPDDNDEGFRTPAPGALNGTYGTFTFDPVTGDWTYTLDNSRIATQALTEGQEVTETLTVESADGSASQVITVTVTGSNDVPVVSDGSAILVEDTDVDADGMLVATGTLTITDPDAGESAFDPASLAFVPAVPGALPLGVMVVNANGAWTYEIDNSLPAVQALAASETLTETFTVVSLDGTATSTITITVTGTNDVPVINIGSELTGSVTEVADGEPDENGVTHSQTGVISFTDADLSNTHAVTFTPEGPGYLGDFSLTSPGAGERDFSWTFEVPDSVLDSLPASSTLVQRYEVRVTDSSGAFTTETVVITIQGSNDRPEPEDDMTLIAIGQVAQMDVVANDTDVDTGETAKLQVTAVEGQAILPGETISLADGRGTVALTGRGDLEFTPAPGVQGQVTLTYTVDDGSGTTNATANADWVINIVGVEMQDDASPASPITGDGVLSQLDDLTAVEISGQTPVGGSLTELKVTDGNGLAVTVPVGAVVIGPDGSFTVTADLTSLADGPLTVEMTTEDPAGNSLTVTDNLLKDTVTEVTINPLVVVEGQIPVISGTAEPGSKVTITVRGNPPVELDVDGSGTWSLTLSSPLPTGPVSIEASSVDPYGNTDSAERDLSGLDLTDEEPAGPEHIMVYEAGLAGGTDAGSGSDRASSTFQIQPGLTSLAHITIGGTLAAGTVIGGTVIPVAALEAATPAAPATATTEYGTISITDYNPVTGVISYVYSLGGNVEAPGLGNNVATETIQIAVVETDGDTRIDSLVAAVVDDIPATPPTPAVLTLTEGETGGQLVGGGLLHNAVLGADGGRVYEINYTDRSGAAQSTTVGLTQITVDTQYGTLTVSADGAWTYAALDSVAHVQPANDTQLRDDFSFNVIDGDGDTTDFVTQGIIVLDTVPEIGTLDPVTIDEAALASGSEPDPAGTSVSGSLNLTPGQDSFIVTLLDTAGEVPVLTSGGQPVTYAWNAATSTLTGSAMLDGVSTAVLTLQVTNGTAANAGYVFTLLRPLDHGRDDSLVLDFGVLVTDSDGDTDAARLLITVLDDAPAEELDFTINEDGNQTFNTSADASPQNTTISQTGVPLNGTPNAAGGMDYPSDHGVITVNADGTITYVPAPNFSGEEVFTFETSDGGTPTATTVTMTVTPVADAPALEAPTTIATDEDVAVAIGLVAPVITDVAPTPGTTDPTQNDGISERIGQIVLSGLPAGAVLTFGGSNHTVGGSGLVTITLTDDGLTTTNADSVLQMTAAEYEAMTVTPPPHASANFIIGVSVSSYEVDAAGVPLPGIAPATSTTSVTVLVRAVTDDVELSFNGVAQLVDQEGRDILITTGTDETGRPVAADVTLYEDGRFNLSSLLKAEFEDLDGSEERTIYVENTTGATIFVGGTEIPAGGSMVFNAPGLSTSTAAFPDLTISAPADFSGDLNGIIVTLRAQDRDADGYQGGGAGSLGVPEADLSNNSVTLNLHVRPVADDVEVLGVTTDEDTAVAFLQGISLTDRSTGSSAGGSEIIVSVSFTVPEDWEVTPPTNPVAGMSTTYDAATGLYTISFIDGTQAEREAALDAFTIRPPANDSRDLTLPLTITTEDSAIVNGVLDTDTRTATHDLSITVNAVPERVGEDRDRDGNPDLTMTPGHEYTTEGSEDEWFNLGTEGGFDLAAGWSNQDQDGSESTSARLTPELTSGDGDAASPIGAQFRWTEDGATVTQTYVGTPIDVPVEALATLEFMGPPNFSGAFNIKVEAYTVDVDPDTNIEATAVSGEAWLTNIRILPVADEVALTINARASGLEDSAIPLSIRPSSSDTSETFTVTIDRVPVGAVLIYGGVAQTIVADPGNPGFGRVVIEDFLATTPLTITPPPESNVDFTLSVSAVSVDAVTILGVPYSSTSVAKTLELNVSVRGVADPVIVTPQAGSYTEQALDDRIATVRLSELYSTQMQDADGSETLTMRVTGLADGFSLTGATLLTPLATGEDRIWVVNAVQLPGVAISTPPNFNGEVVFQVIPVTTENDGNSLTGAPTNVGFEVTPSPEATIAVTTVIEEDQLTSLGLQIVHQGVGGVLDTDETLSEIRIAMGDAVTAGYTLYLGEVALTGAGLIPVTDGGVDYYVLTPAQAATLQVLAAPHLDGMLGTLSIGYRVTDPGNDGLADVTSDWQVRNFDLTATPITDAPTLSLFNVTGDAPGLTHDVSAVTVDGPGSVTITTNLASPDSDGSEHVIRIVIDGVPAGVSVAGAEAIGANTWLLVYDGVDAISVDAAGGIQLPVIFEIGTDAGTISDAPITITAQVQDRGNQPAPGTEVLSDSITWTLTSTFVGEGGQLPATIEEWGFRDPAAVEDTSFLLADMVTAQVAAQSTRPNILTVTLTDVPAGTEITGMIRTVISGVETWTATVTTPDGVTAAQVQDALDTLLAGITITAPANANDNNTGDFSFDLRLTTAVQGGGLSESADILDSAIPLQPLTDEAEFVIGLGASDADGRLTESDTSVPLSLTISNPADGAAGTIVDGQLYLTVTTQPGSMAGGIVTGPDGDYTLQAVAGVEGIPNGNYYVIPNVSMGQQLDLDYTPPSGLVEGEVTVTAWVRNIEGEAAEALTSSAGVTLPVSISNDGVTVAVPVVTGAEAADAKNTSLIELTGLSVVLNDNDGSEVINSILLSNLPEGFLVFTGSSAGDAGLAAMASNAGGANGLNTWVLAPGGESLPAYVAILPPAHWSGTIPGGDGTGNGLTLIVSSGETALSESLVESFAMGGITIRPVANGLTLDSTATFGTEGRIIPFNLNASMVDDAAVPNVLPADSSVETATLQITGLGQYASFYTGGTLLTAGVTYDEDADTYTLTGLSQAQLDALGFLQANRAIIDVDSAAPGRQIGIRAWTVDGESTSAVETDTLTLNLRAQLPTMGADRLLWTGAMIDGGAGSDTIVLRLGESLNGATLAANLRNIEVLDLRIEGANAITDLTAAQVKEMIGAGNTLTIMGGSDDDLSFAGSWIDNGDGTYSGTTGGNTVTVNVTGGIEVTPPVGGFTSLILPFAFAGEEESFGLAALDVTPVSEANVSAPADQITEEELFLPDGVADDLSDLLPVESARSDEGAAPDSSSAGADWEAEPAWSTLTAALEDDLLQSV